MNNRMIEPAFGNNSSCIVFCTDNGYIPITSVAIQSIIDQSSSENFYDIIIFHSRVNETNQLEVVRMCEGFSNVSIRFLDIKDYAIEHSFFTSNRENFTEEAYYRLFIPWLTSDFYTRALYLDGDMIVRQDINFLLHEDIGDNLIAAVRDYWGICHCYIPGDSRRSYRESIGITEMDDYIISSTIVFNLKKFRDEFRLEEVIRLIESRQWEQHDQDVINVMCKGRILLLSPLWGYTCDYGQNKYLPLYLQSELHIAEVDPAIYHFAADQHKPWCKIDDKYNIEFWEIADRIPFFNELINSIDLPINKGIVLRRLSQGVFLQKNTSEGMEYCYKQVKIPGACVQYRILDVKNGILHFEGMAAFFSTLSDSKTEIYMSLNNELISPTSRRREDEYQQDVNILLYRGESFKFDIPLNVETKTYNMLIICKIDGVLVKTSDQICNYFSINENYRSAYYENENWIVKKKKNHFEISYSGWKEKIYSERAFLKELWSRKTWPERKSVFIRCFYHLFHRVLIKPIWLISDRKSVADDNGEAFFRYVNEKHRKEINSFFVIRKDSPDYMRIKKYGKVLDINSKWYKVLSLFATVLISSQTDKIFRSPVWYMTPYHDIISRGKYVYLRHGIFFTDCSRWLCRKNQQFNGFVTSAFPEYDSVINGEYDYTSNEVWLTGMPRFDYLENREKKLVTIMPTWRMYLCIEQNSITGDWDVVHNFADSKYVKFYRDLLNHPRLNKRAAELGYTLQFRAHPAIRRHLKMFGFRPEVNVVDKGISYKEIYKTSSLIVTDYSSAIIDFIYLRKPIIYCQFDKDEFFSGKHICDSGYFNYERDGFGEVEYNLEETVDRIIEYMENGCKLKDRYRERINRFFAFDDRHNCQRVYDHIISM